MTPITELGYAWCRYQDAKTDDERAAAMADVRRLVKAAGHTRAFVLVQTGPPRVTTVAWGVDGRMLR